jgi:ACR3 family arsenite transporter
MSVFERYRTLWESIVVGIALGHVMPVVFRAIGSAENGRNLPKVV